MKKILILFSLLLSVSSFANDRFDLAKQWLDQLSESVTMFRGQFSANAKDILPFGSNSFCNRVGEFQGQYQAALFLVQRDAEKLSDRNYFTHLSITLCESAMADTLYNREKALKEVEDMLGKISMLRNAIP